MIAQAALTVPVSPLLLWVVIILSLVTLVGVFWSIVRENHLFGMNAEQTHTTKDMERTFLVVSDNLKSLERQVERSDDLSESRRQEVIRLVVDVEKRLTDAMRDLFSRHSQTNFSVNTGDQGTRIHGGQNNIGQTDIHGNQMQ